MPVIPATQEAEAGESLEPGRQRLRRAEITSLLSSLGNKSKTPSQEKIKQKAATHWDHERFLPVGPHIEERHNRIVNNYKNNNSITISKTMVVQRLNSWGNGELLFNGYKISVTQDE